MNNKIKGVIVFIPGYTLSKIVFRNYIGQLEEWKYYIFEYQEYKNLSKIVDALNNLLHQYKGTRIIIVGQSIGFKIGLLASIGNENITHLFGFNPYFYPPKKFMLNRFFHESLVKSIAHFLSLPLCRFITFQFATPRNLLKIRELSGNKTYKSFKLFRNLYEIRANRSDYTNRLINPLFYLYDTNSILVPTSKNITILIGKSDKLLEKGFDGAYYNKIISDLKQAKIFYLEGGHEGFLENEDEWIPVFKNLIALI